MSYLCLVAGRRGAVIASDSRLTFNYRGKDRAHPMDHRRKVFTADHGRILYGLAGASCQGLLDMQPALAAIFHLPGLTLEARLLKAICCGEYLTGKAFKASSYQRDSLQTLFYAACAEGGQPEVGYIDIKNGRLLRWERCRIPCMLQAGSNADRLDFGNFVRPAADADLKTMSAKAEKRVLEAIAFDRQAAAADPAYQARVGGSVRMVTLAFAQAPAQRS